MYHTIYTVLLITVSYKYYMTHIQGGQSQTAPYRSTSSQKNSSPRSSPHSGSVTRQIIKKWGPYAEVRVEFNSARHREQLSLHCPQKIAATDDNSALREEMRALEPVRKTHSLARYAVSLWVSPARSALSTTRTAGTSPSGRPSAPPLVNVSLSSFPPPHPIPPRSNMRVQQVPP